MRINPFRAVLICLFLGVITFAIVRASAQQAAAARFAVGHAYDIITMSGRETVRVTVREDSAGWVKVDFLKPQTGKDIWLNTRLVLEAWENPYLRGK